MLDPYDKFIYAMGFAFEWFWAGVFLSWGLRAGGGVLCRDRKEPPAEETEVPKRRSA